MSTSRILAGLAAAAAVSIFTATLPASAVPSLSPLKPLGLEQSAVEQTHGWHRRCRKGWSDWHKHVRGVGRITCGTRKCWKNKWGGLSCAWF